MSHNRPSLTRTCWSEVKNEVKSVNAELFEIIDEINPSDDMALYIAEYPYGTIIDDGDFYYPTESGELAKRSSGKLSKEVERDFEYCGDSIPVGLVLDKVVELFTHTGKQHSPWSIYYPGDMFALSGYLPSNSSHPFHILSMSSGVRNLYMLPNIGDSFYHHKLQLHFKTSINPPKSISEHWGVFKTIYDLSNSNTWRSKVLLFTTQWAEYFTHGTNWANLRLYFYDVSWKRTAFERNRRFYDLAISMAQCARNLKPDPYIIDTSKHLFKIIANGAPGFIFSTNDNFAPTKFLEDVYINVYRLKDYYPQILVPGYINEQKPVYYSLNAPTALEYSLSARKASSTIYKLRELQHTLTVLIDEITKSQHELEGTKMLNLLSDTQIAYFHNKIDRLSNIQHSSEILAFDQLKVRSEEFADSGAFVRGCIGFKKRI